MKGLAARLTGCPDALYRRCPIDVGVNAAHTIMGSRSNRNRFVYGVDEIEPHGDLSDQG